MKKLLTLILVLGLVPMASAGLQIGTRLVDVEIDPSNGITLISLDAQPTPVAVFISPAGMPWTYEFHQFGDLNQFEEFGTVLAAEYGIHDFPEAEAYSLGVASTIKGFLQVGPYWTARLGIEGVTYQAERPDDPAKLVGRIDLANYDTYEIFATAYAVVPEPATMLLLGLGGLFLRRK